MVVLLTAVPAGIPSLSLGNGSPSLIGLSGHAKVGYWQCRVASRGTWVSASILYFYG
jgi:hypothetical protein